MKDNQITGKSSVFHGPFNEPVVKHIPIEIWSEISLETKLENGLYTFSHETTDSRDEYWIRNSGGKVYIVTEVCNGKR
jgi:hypothetical protein